MVTIDPGDVADLLERVPAPMLLLDRTGQVIHGNDAAQHLLAGTSAIRIAGRTLTARRKDEDRNLREGIAALSADRPAGLVCLRSREGVPVIAIDLHRLPSGTIVLRLSDVTFRTPPSAARLKDLFGLTPAEARVATAMMAGLGIGAIAKAHGVEAETVRTQVKRIRNKTGARSQTQLLCILAAIGSDFVTSRP